MKADEKASTKVLERFFAMWGGTAGFVVGAALMALAVKVLGGWPPGEAYLRRRASALTEVGQAVTRH